jgi:hypothetical protein
MYQVFCRKVNPKMGNNHKEFRESQKLFQKNILPFLVTQIAASGDEVALRECSLATDLIHWEQRHNGYTECFETNYAVV